MMPRRGFCGAASVRGSSARWACSGRRFRSSRVSVDLGALPLCWLAAWARLRASCARCSASALRWAFCLATMLAMTWLSWRSLACSWASFWRRALMSWLSWLLLAWAWLWVCPSFFSFCRCWAASCSMRLSSALMACSWVLSSVCCCTSLVIRALLAWLMWRV